MPKKTPELCYSGAFCNTWAVQEAATGTVSGPYKARLQHLSVLSINVLYLSKPENQSILADKKEINVSEQIRLVIAVPNRKFTKKDLQIVFDSQEYFITGN